MTYTFVWTAGAGTGKVTRQTYLSAGLTDKIG
jgi:hypothetical protein